MIVMVENQWMSECSYLLYQGAQVVLELGQAAFDFDVFSS